MNRLRLHLLACRVFERELEALATHAKSALHIQYLEMALHEKPGEQLRAALQDAVHAVPTGSADAVALGYGLCNRGLVGLRAGSVPVVIPRAHDCLGILLGSSERYLAELDKEAGTYFQSPGWIDHLPADRSLRPLAAGMGSSLAPNREELVARYGEDNAEFLMQELAGMTRHYRRLAFISTPVKGCDGCAHQARAIAAQQNWAFHELEGDLGWLQRLLDGDWNEREFLIVKPGEQVVLRHDALLIGAEREASPKSEVGSPKEARNPNSEGRLQNRSRGRESAPISGELNPETRRVTEGRSLRGQDGAARRSGAEDVRKPDAGAHSDGMARWGANPHSGLGPSDFFRTSGFGLRPSFPPPP